MDTGEFRSVIYSHYEKEGRDFPWRQDKVSPWGILVSEFMLQQTQTERVVPYWNRWMEKWPGPGDLCAATLEEALREWSGLGYNRRGRYLKECAGIICEKHGAQVPGTPGELVTLPGIGPYAAGAIACFAYNYPAVFIETNIRAVMIHFFFGSREAIKDSEIFPVLAECLDRRNPRKWYWALMDYGARLKKLTPNPGRRSAHYTPQGAFKGSFRQIRGGIIRILVSSGPAGAAEIKKRLDTETGEEDFYRALGALEKESLVAEEGGMYRIQGVTERRKLSP
jgi:A/G-specific adenine glycosylase